MKDKDQSWRKCNRCGKFISDKEFEDGAIRYQTVPDNAFGGEEWENYCKKCWVLEKAEEI